MEVDLLVFLGLIALLVALGLSLFGLAVYSGLNFVPAVSTGPAPLPACRIAYKFLRGAYSGNIVGATFTEATSIAPKAKVLGLFYDNPQDTAEERLRSAIGVVLSGEGLDSVPEETEALLKEKGFAVHELPGIGASVNSSFPHTTSLSVRLAPMRVYPRLSEYILAEDLCAYPMLEVYGGDSIQFAAPLSQQDAFFVPEALVEEDSEPEQLGSDLMEEEDTDSTADDEDPDTDSTAQSSPSATESDFEQIQAADIAPTLKEEP